MYGGGPPGFGVGPNFFFLSELAMSSIAKEFDSSSKTPKIASVDSPTRLAEASANKAQPVALEVSVTVNGVRTVEGGNKREPFSESSKTVLVFSNGAVIRLTATLSPGQLLFLTNEKTKKEVVCQVVKSKNYRNVSGYVELEFTEPVVGFWGMRFPNDRVASAPAPSSPVAKVSCVPPPAISPSITKVPAPPAAIAPAAPPTETVSSVLPAAAPPVAELPAPSAISAPVPPEPLVSKPVELQIVKSEPVTLSSPEISASILEPSSPPEQKWERESESSEAIKLHTARLQEQLSSMLFSGVESDKSEPPSIAAAPIENESISDITSKVIEISASQTAPALPSSGAQDSPRVLNSSLDEESIKIPAWLEPLARNSVAPASTQDLIERAKSKLSTEQPETSYPVPDVIAAMETEPAPELRIPTFGSQLPLDEEPSGAERTSGGSNKGMLIGAVAAGIIMLASGGFWYAKQQGGSSHPAVPAPSAEAMGVVATPAPQTPVVSTPAQTSSVISSVEVPPTDAPSHTAPILDASEKSKSADRVNPVLSKVVQPAATSLPQRSQPELKLQSQPQPEPAKPSLGKIHLAAPKVNRQTGSQDSVSGDSELTLSAEQAVPNSDSMNGGLVTGSVKGPAAPVAPLPVGGDVRPAKLLSSVPPVYPTLARNQHIGGDVKIDALIDANGRVTSMTVLAGPTLLRQAAMDALHQWKYQPAALDGKPVPMHLTITIQFRLQQ
jgi:protein TonB